MIYTVLKIEEDLDYGCEERLPGSPVMAVLTLQDEQGKKKIIRYPDRELYELGVNEGDRISYEAGKNLEKVVDRTGGRQEPGWESGQVEIRNAKDVFGLIEAFAVVGAMVGIIIGVIATDYTTADDIGKCLVIVSVLTAAFCQIIIWIIKRKDLRKRRKHRNKR